MTEIAGGSEPGKALEDQPDEAEETPKGCITIDPTIGVFLKLDGMNMVDFLDRKRAEVEGLIAGARALIELDRLATGWDDLTEAAGGADAAVRALGPIRGTDQEVAQEMLVSARLALMDLYTAAIAAADACRASSRAADA